jgi:NadR type nicotinamide-nucleotide adenylyltransferase
LKDFVAALKRKGHDIRELPARRWLELVRNKPLTAEETSAALSLCRAFPDEKLFQRQRTMDLFQATGVAFDTRRTDAALKGTGVYCPAADERLLDLYIGQFLKKPRPLKICLFGPESTGKSTMAEKLAKHFGAAFVAEFAKEHIAAHDGNITADDIPQIAAGQLRTEAEAAATEQNLLFCDTDLLTTKIWSERLFGSCPGWIQDAAELQHYDLYFMMDIDAPWVADIHRYLPEERRSFLDLCCKTLKHHDRKYIMLSGSWDKKFQTACAAVERLQARKQEKAA